MTLPPRGILRPCRTAWVPFFLPADPSEKEVRDPGHAQRQRPPQALALAPAPLVAPAVGSTHPVWASGGQMATGSQGGITGLTPGPKANSPPVQQDYPRI